MRNTIKRLALGAAVALGLAAAPAMLAQAHQTGASTSPYIASNPALLSALNLPAHAVQQTSELVHNLATQTSATINVTQNGSLITTKLSAALTTSIIMADRNDVNTLIMQEDITLTDPVTLDHKNVVLDLAGHTLTINVTTTHDVDLNPHEGFFLLKGSIFTIKDSVGNGKITYEGTQIPLINATHTTSAYIDSNPSPITIQGNSPSQPLTIVSTVPNPVITTPTTVSITNATIYGANTVLVMDSNVGGLHNSGVHIKDSQLISGVPGDSSLAGTVPAYTVTENLPAGARLTPVSTIGVSDTNGVSGQLDQPDVTASLFPQSFVYEDNDVEYPVTITSTDYADYFYDFNKDAGTGVITGAVYQGTGTAPTFTRTVYLPTGAQVTPVTALTATDSNADGQISTAELAAAAGTTLTCNVYSTHTVTINSADFSKYTVNATLASGSTYTVNSLTYIGTGCPEDTYTPNGIVVSFNSGGPLVLDGAVLRSGFNGHSVTVSSTSKGDVTVKGNTLVQAGGSTDAFAFSGDGHLSIQSGTFKSQWGKAASIDSGTSDITGGTFLTLMDDALTAQAQYVKDQADYRVAQGLNTSLYSIISSDADGNVLQTGVSTLRKGMALAINGGAGAVVNVKSGVFFGENALLIVAPSSITSSPLITITSDTALTNPRFTGAVGDSQQYSSGLVDRKKYFHIKSGYYFNRISGSLDAITQQSLLTANLYHGHLASDFYPTGTTYGKRVKVDAASSVAAIDRTSTTGSIEYFHYLNEAFEDVLPGETIYLTHDAPRPIEATIAVSPPITINTSGPVNAGTALAAVDVVNTLTSSWSFTGTASDGNSYTVTAADVTAQSCKLVADSTLGAAGSVTVSEIVVGTGEPNRYTPAELSFDSADYPSPAPVTFDLNGHKLQVEAGRTWYASDDTNFDDRNFDVGKYFNKSYIYVGSNATLNLANTGGAGKIVVVNHDYIITKPSPNSADLEAAAKKRSMMGITVHSGGHLNVCGVPIVHTGDEYSVTDWGTDTYTGACVMVSNAEFTLDSGDVLTVTKGRSGVNNAAALLVENNAEGAKDFKVLVKPGSKLLSDSVYSGAAKVNSGTLTVEADTGTTSALIQGGIYGIQVMKDGNAVIHGGKIKANTPLVNGTMLAPPAGLTSDTSAAIAAGGAFGANDAITTSSIAFPFDATTADGQKVIITKDAVEMGLFEFISSSGVSGAANAQTVDAVRYTGLFNLANGAELDVPLGFSVLNNSGSAIVANGSFAPADVVLTMGGAGSSFTTTYRKQKVTITATEVTAPDYSFTTEMGCATGAVGAVSHIYRTGTAVTGLPATHQEHGGVALFVEENGSALVRVTGGVFMGSGAVTLGSHTDPPEDTSLWQRHIIISDGKFCGPVLRNTDGKTYPVVYSRDNGISILKGLFYTPESDVAGARVGLEPDSLYIEPYCGKIAPGTAGMTDSLAWEVEYNPTGQDAWFNGNFYSTLSAAVSDAVSTFGDATDMPATIILLRDINDTNGNELVDGSLDIGTNSTLRLTSSRRFTLSSFFTATDTLKDKYISDVEAAAALPSTAYPLTANYLLPTNNQTITVTFNSSADLTGWSFYGTTSDGGTTYTVTSCAYTGSFSSAPTFAITPSYQAVPAKINIDLNGFTLQAGNNTSTGTITVKDGAQLSIEDNSAVASGKVRATDGSAVITATDAGSTVLLKGGTYETDATATSRCVETLSSAKTTVQDGVEFAVAGGTGLLTKDGGKTEIRGGTFTATAGTLVQNDGCTTSATYSAAVPAGTALADINFPLVLGGNTETPEIVGRSYAVNPAGDVTVAIDDLTTTTDIRGGTFISTSTTSPAIRGNGGVLDITVTNSVSTINIESAGTALEVNGGRTYVGQYANNQTPNDALVNILTHSATQPAVVVTDTVSTAGLSVMSGTLENDNASTKPLIDATNVKTYTSGTDVCVPTVATVGAYAKNASTPKVTGTYDAIGKQVAHTPTITKGQTLSLLGGLYAEAGNTAELWEDPRVFIPSGLTGATTGTPSVKEDIKARGNIPQNVIANWVEADRAYTGSTTVLIQPPSSKYEVFAATDTGYLNPLVYGTDFSVTLVDPAATDQFIGAGHTINVKVEGKGKYTGEINTTYTIGKLKLDGSNTVITFLTPDTGTNEYEYKYGGVKAPVKVEWVHGTPPTTTTLVEGQDYQLTYSGYINVGVNTPKVTVLGTGNFEGTVSQTYTIHPRSISSCTIDPLPDEGFRNAAIQPLPVVKDGTNTLSNGIDYLLSYTNNVDLGTATVTVTGKNNYTNTISTTFNITLVGSEYTKVPPVAGKTAADARASIEAAGLTIRATTEETSNDVAKGAVTRVSPGEGTWVKKGSAVTMFVSLGVPSSAEVDIPDVVGMEYTVAVRELQKVSLRVVYEMQESEDVPVNHVISITPTGKARKGDTVTLAISTGTEKIKMPDVVGQYESSALGVLEGAEYQFAVTVRQESSETVKYGRVISQSPTAYSMVAKGAPVTIVVSSGPASSEDPTTATTPTTPASPVSPTTPASPTSPSSPSSPSDPTTPASPDYPKVVVSDETVPEVYGDTAKAEVITYFDGTKETKLTTGDGTQATGWVTAGGKKYYATADGTAATGKTTIGDETFFFASDGTVQTGWVYDSTNDTWSYATPASEAAETGATEGALKKNAWVYTDGQWFITDSNGVMVTGWVIDPWGSGTWYYFNPSSTSGTRGAMQTGWFYDGFDWYYANESGEMQTGWIYTDGAWYLMSASGAMRTGWMWDGGAWYYANQAGAMQVGWRYMDQAWYLLNPESNAGVSQGVMLTGWVWNGNAWYYFNNDGTMLRSAWTPDGYWINADGVMVG